MTLIPLEPPTGIETDEKLWCRISESNRSPEFASDTDKGDPTNYFESLVELALFNWPSMTLAAMFEWQSRESVRITGHLKRNRQ